MGPGSRIKTGVRFMIVVSGKKEKKNNFQKERWRHNNNTNRKELKHKFRKVVVDIGKMHNMHQASRALRMRVAIFVALAWKMGARTKDGMKYFCNSNIEAK